METLKLAVNGTLAAFGVVAWASAMIILVIPLAATFGAIAGEVTSWFWGATLLETLRALGLPPEVKLWQLGCLGGFLSGCLVKPSRR